MGCEIDFVGDLHRSTKRDYLARAMDPQRADNCEIAKQFNCDYWDGHRTFGYGGYQYDGRWSSVAARILAHYGIEDHPHTRVLDVGCGKAHLLYEMKVLMPSLSIAGLDISKYALNAAPELVKPFLYEGSAEKCWWAATDHLSDRNDLRDDFRCDLVISFATLHNLPISKLMMAIEGIKHLTRAKVGRPRPHGYILVESWRTEQERLNLLNWQLTCESFHSPEEWKWIFDRCGYQGDYGFIYFE